MYFRQTFSRVRGELMVATDPFLYSFPFQLLSDYFWGGNNGTLRKLEKKKTGFDLSKFRKGDDEKSSIKLVRIFTSLWIMFEIFAVEMRKMELRGSFVLLCIFISCLVAHISSDLLRSLNPHEAG